MKKVTYKIKKSWLIGAASCLGLVTIVYFLTQPIDSYSLSTSGCSGVGSSTNKANRYSILKGEREQFYAFKQSIPESRWELSKVLCVTDTETHSLYVF